MEGMKPAVVFDLDGTLADTVPVIAHHIAETITGFGTLVRPEDVVPYIGRPLEVALAELAERPADDPRIAEIIDAYARWRGAVDVHGGRFLPARRPRTPAAAAQSRPRRRRRHRQAAR